jgi:hypothetical protein
MHEALARLLNDVLGWTFLPEVSFSIYGERGVIDVLAWHQEQETLLVVELKTEIVDVQELIGRVDQKRRLARRVAADRGWHPQRVGVWVVLASSRTSHRRIAAHVNTLRAAFPDDGRAVHGWLANPDRRLSCLSFLPISYERALRRRPASLKRVRRPARKKREQG